MIDHGAQDPGAGLRIAGSPSAEEVAVVVALLASLPSAPPAAPRPRALWSRPSRMHRRIAAPGPGAWRASFLPGAGSN